MLRGKAPAASVGDVELRGCQRVGCAERGEVCDEGEASAGLLACLLLRQHSQEVVAQFDGQSFTGVVEDVDGVDQVVGGVGGEVGELP